MDDMSGSEQDANSQSPSPGAASFSAAFPGFLEALRVWIKVGLLSFGGPTGQIALMHREFVEKRRWVSDARFLHALNYCMLLPGPEAQQLAIYMGWLLHRTWGGIAAGALFVMPGALLLFFISYIYVVYGDVPVVSAVFYGLKPAVMAIVAAAVLRIGRKVLKNPAMWIISGLAFIAIFFLGAPFPAIIIGAGVAGLAGGKFYPEKFNVVGGHVPSGGEQPVTTAVSDAIAIRPTSLERTLLVSSVCLLAWFAPVLLFALQLGLDHTIVQEGLFFSKAAVVTFGGAYAVLPYVAQQAVENHQWVTTAQMMDGLGLAETTPGPLILVLQFVGFLGGWQQPGHLSPLLSALFGAFITSWVTFVPGFLFIFAGAPHIENLRGNVALNSALSAVTAAVVGVVLNLAVWFGLSVLFPAAGGIDAFALLISVVVFAGLLKWNWDVVPVVISCGVLGIVYHLLL
jgi:chromate transporter